MSVAMEAAELEAASFRRRLMRWYRSYARKLPWRGIDDPYRTWVSEVMLQQTRVAAVLEHYARFLERFPSLGALAAASEGEVLAAWSGLGYYRRARMLRRGAQFVVEELGGTMPRTAETLRALPGVGEYTSAAIASIAFGESVAVVDGNVERVLLRLLGRVEDLSAAGARRVRAEAARLVPRRGAGDHNQAMMELGATICLPRGPLCLQCPVVAMCRTRGEHGTQARARGERRQAAYLLEVREATVLLARRPLEARLMAGMYELPPLPLDAVEGLQARLTLRHSITNTVYAVDVYQGALRPAVPVDAAALEWIEISRLPHVPLTGLARKALRRLGVLGSAHELRASSPAELMGGTPDLTES